MDIIEKSAVEYMEGLYEVRVLLGGSFTQGPTTSLGLDDQDQWLKLFHKQRIGPLLQSF